MEEDLRAKIKEIKETLEKSKDIKLDLSKEEDLVIGIMNLISLEEHFFFSGAKTKNPIYYDLLLKVREIRKDLMKKVVRPAEEGAEVWCISKHLLAATMRLYETGEKLLSIGKREEAEQLFKYSYDLFTIFWGLNLGLIESSNFELDENVKKEYEKSKDIDEEIEKISEKKGKIRDLLKKIIDCCIE